MNHLDHLLDTGPGHDACGVALVAETSGAPGRRAVAGALEALARMEHRGAVGADGSGDGAGLLLALPDAFLRRRMGDEGVALPPPGRYAVGMLFLPRGRRERARVEALAEAVVEASGHAVLGWRDVPVHPAAVGPTARRARPHVRQLFVAAGAADDGAFARRLWVARRRIEREAGDADVHVASLSARTLVYKALATGAGLAAFYPELGDADMAAWTAVAHTRFSTNTLPAWRLAHPFTHLAHNGEINTLRGNREWIRAREADLRSTPLGAELAPGLPLIDDAWSDSAALDAALELLLLGGRGLGHAVMQLVPAAWEGDQELPDDVRGFYRHHAALSEPWDGPAALAFTDGRAAGAALDRNGLRPLRLAATDDGLVAITSEAGALPLPAARVERLGRLGPGGIAVVDPARGGLAVDGAVRDAVARRRPYARWADAVEVPVARAAPRGAVAPGIRRRQALFGYTDEELRVVVAAMASAGAEPDSSMGTDTPVAPLAERPPLVFAYFKQLFAQVTNPPIDPLRERSVMSLETRLGPRRIPCADGPAVPQAVLPGPVLTPEDLAALRAALGGRVATVPALVEIGPGAAGVRTALEAVAAAATAAIEAGATVLVLSDRAAGPDAAPLPSLLALGALRRDLSLRGLGARAAIVVESGEPRDTSQVALLVGYGAAAVVPYLALESAADLAADGLAAAEPAVAVENVRAALEKGLLKVMSKMGISTVAGYCGARPFEALGLGAEVVERAFPGTTSRVGGADLADLAAAVDARHRAAFAAAPALADGGEHALRIGGPAHRWRPETIVPLQRAARGGGDEEYNRLAAAADADDGPATALRHLLRLRPERGPVPLDAVEPAAAIVRRFTSGAMSLGSIAEEAHETLAVAMNRIGGRSNSGEGGEDLRRSVPDPNGDLRRSAIKQVASGRFGVTAAYLADADELQIKIAQGSKPGEGGQLPGHKVDPTIARLRHSTPGVGLISPPPHHDIYSIEDLAQLIHDLRAVNPAARVSVKLVSAAGVGTIAAGVAKAGADAITISGHDGGTGASPLMSVKNAGLPWELGIAEAHASLVANGLRGRVRLAVDGGLVTGRDVVVAALLGAEEFGFATAPLIALGCVMMRVCHLNTCPVGIATRDPVLRRRFAGRPEHVVRYLVLVAEHARRLVAELGATRLDDLVGRADLLEQAAGAPSGVDLSALLRARPGRADGRRPRRAAAASVEDPLLPRIQAALDRGLAFAAGDAIAPADRTVGARVSGMLARRGAGGLPVAPVTLRFRGAAGQSFGAFAAEGVDLLLEGEANDGVGKGLSGGRVVLVPPRGLPRADGQVLLGNAALYGATAGELFVRGAAGERFAVRNSGAAAVVEGVGDHGCEYMTGGVVVVLGRVGRNFAAGMSGGVVYVADHAGTLAGRLNTAAAAIEPLDGEDLDALRALLLDHAARTGSGRARTALVALDRGAHGFVKVMPHDLRRALAAAEPDAMVAARA